jgi:nitronate monooxygenase
MGTAFLASAESGASAIHKQMILSSNEDDTDLTSAYTGKAARGIQTRFMNEMRSYPGAIPAYPIQNALTRDIRQAAAKSNNPEFMSLWAGQGLRLAVDQPAAVIVQRTIEQARALIGRFLSDGECHG